jgi:hypothetical protein
MATTKSFTSKSGSGVTVWMATESGASQEIRIDTGQTIEVEDKRVIDALKGSSEVVEVKTAAPKQEAKQEVKAEVKEEPAPEPKEEPKTEERKPAEATPPRDAKGSEKGNDKGNGRASGRGGRR